MKIKKVNENNKMEYMDLLLIGDEEEAAILKYLDRCDVFILEDENILRTICAVEKIDSNFIEIKNLATYESSQNKGYGSKILQWIENYYKDNLKSIKYIILGTGETKKNIEFYKSKGYQEYDRIVNFFIDNYEEEIIDEGIVLKDMIILRKIL